MSDAMGARKTKEEIGVFEACYLAFACPSPKSTIRHYGLCSVLWPFASLVIQRSFRIFVLGNGVTVEDKDR